MQKRIILYKDGTRAFAQGNLTVKTSKQVQEEILVEGDEKITNAEFEGFALNPGKTGVVAFVNKMRNEANLEKADPLKKGGKAGIIPGRVSRLLNSEKTATF